MKLPRDLINPPPDTCGETWENHMDQKKYHVKIEFTDGTYTNIVTASTEGQAYELALQDARMSTTNPVFVGRVVSHQTHLLPEKP